MVPGILETFFTQENYLGIFPFLPRNITQEYYLGRIFFFLGTYSQVLFKALLRFLGTSSQVNYLGLICPFSIVDHFLCFTKCRFYVLPRQNTQEKSKYSQELVPRYFFNDFNFTQVFYLGTSMLRKEEYIYQDMLVSIHRKVQQETKNED